MQDNASTGFKLFPPMLNRNKMKEKKQLIYYDETIEEANSKRYKGVTKKYQLLMIPTLLGLNRF